MDNDTPGVERRIRKAYSLRSCIKTAIEELAAEGQELTYHSIRKRAGGGSNNTIKDEVELYNQRETSKMVTKVGATPAEREAHLRKEISTLNAIIAELKAEIAGQRRVIDGMTRGLEAARELPEHISERLERLHGQLRTEALAVKAITAVLARRAKEIGAEGGTTSAKPSGADALVTARMDRAVQDLMVMSERFRVLNAYVHEHLGLDYDDIIKR